MQMNYYPSRTIEPQAINDFDIINVADPFQFDMDPDPDPRIRFCEITDPDPDPAPNPT